MKKLKKTLSILKHKATTDTKRYPTTEAFINIIKDRIHKLSIDQQKTKHENYSYLDQIHREKATKPYFSLERNMRMNQDRIITELKNNNTQRSYTRSREIVELAARPYYKNLYDCKSTKAEAQIKALDSINKIIPPELRKSMAKALTQEEIEAAIENLAKGKAPGSDGITIDFFKKFKTLLAPLLIQLYTQSYKTETLPPSTRASIISLLHKKKERNNIKNYRPLSLTNNDYKILSKALQLRMNPAMNHIIGTEQNGFVPARFIAENNMLLHEIIEYTTINKNSMGGLLLFLDFEKAFDRVDHNFMLSVLDRMAFPTEFMNWIKLLYTSATSSVRINNITSKGFELHSGVRQGCPISPLLFACVVECMANMIRQDQNVRGIIKHPI